MGNRKRNHESNGSDETAAHTSIEVAAATYDSVTRELSERVAAADVGVADAEAALAIARDELLGAAPNEAIARQGAVVVAEAAVRRARDHAEAVRSEQTAELAAARAQLAEVAHANQARAAVDAKLAGQIELDRVAKAAADAAASNKRELRALAERYVAAARLSGTAPLPGGYVDAALAAARARSLGTPVTRELAHGLIIALGLEHVLHSTGATLHSEQLLSFAEMVDLALDGTLAEEVQRRKEERDRNRKPDPYGVAHREFAAAIDEEQRLRIELDSYGDGKGRRELEQRHRAAAARAETARENRNDARDRMARNNAEEEQVSL